MRRQRSIWVLTATVQLLLVSTPATWGCGSDATGACPMSDCPMAIPETDMGCHDPVPVDDQDQTACDSASQDMIACCDAPAELQPVGLESPRSATDSATPAVLVVGGVESLSPAHPPDRVLHRIASKRYEMGRYTLLASFLL